ncbi:MAG: hypothetical protein WD595_02330 [Waddliaceae bacterium]
MTAIPFSRQLTYALFALLLPVVAVFFSFYIKKTALNEQADHLAYIEQKALNRESKQAQNIQVREFFKNADHYYLDKYIESLTFLAPEIESLNKMVSSKNFAGDDAIKKRLDFLTGTENKPIFHETKVETYPFFQETERSLQKPIQLNSEDLQKLLSLIEGMSIGPHEPAPERPQMIILDFRLEKQASLEGNEVFQLNLKLLTREYS